MFGMGEKGTTNLITRVLANVGKRLETVPDPTQIHYHLPRSQAHPEVSQAQALRVPAFCVERRNSRDVCCSCSAYLFSGRGMWDP